MRVRIFACLLAALVAVGLPHSASGLSSVVPASEADDRSANPAQAVRQGIDVLSTFVRDSSSVDAQTRRDLLDDQVAPYFDFEYMAEWAAGTFARRLSEAQMAALGDKVRNIFVAAMARNLGAGAQPPANIQLGRDRRGSSASERVVPVRVRLLDGSLMRLEFRCYWNGKGWRIFDVSANGASALAYLRQNIAHLLRSRGPKALAD